MRLKSPLETNNKCRATARAGRPCAAPAVRGGSYCALHSDPQRAAQLGRRGGMRNRHVYESDRTEVAPPRNATDIREMLAKLMVEILAGKRDPKLGTTLGYLGTMLLKAIETADLEQRLEKLEHAVLENANEHSTSE